MENEISDIRLHTQQVTLVRGLAQLFLVEMFFLNYQQTIYIDNFKKQNPDD